MAAGNVTGITNDTEKNNKYQYSKVSLSLENCILPEEKLSPSPSQLDGLDLDVEVELRILGCELIQISGILLKLPQVAMATGQVLFQRFYYSKSFVRHMMEVVAMACITLASKIEEAPRRIRDVVNVFHHIKQVKSGKTIQPLILDQNYINLKNQVIKAERRILKELGFCVHVKHPHKIIVTLLEVLKVKNKKLMQTAWNYMNDSLRTEVFVRHDPETIACSCIYLSARLLQFPLPNKPAWFLVFNVSEQDIIQISRTILSVYTRKKPDPEKLEKIVEELRKTHQEAKLKAKGIAVQNKIASLSPASQTCSPTNGTKSPLNDKKERNGSKHYDSSPNRSTKDMNHRKRKNDSPFDDGYSPEIKKKNKTSSSGSASSRSPSPRRKTKTPPRGFKESHRSRSRSKSKTRSSKKLKHRSSHKRKHSHSPSPILSPSHHSNKKSYKNKHSEKTHQARSRSRSHERNHHSNSLHEKSHKVRKERVKENHHSRDKKRR
ncbi:cyclin-L1-like [Uloborus diversus]|uniref:cyclin-L1-like n=1 Tax=Uloborus diversus TaxID=327109 RepID=UPI002409D735|nr:cyclin-L1-like [Uloborus diversus]